MPDMDDNPSQCPICGSRVPKRARVCLNCGEPAPQSTSSKSPRGKWLINLTAIVIFFAYFAWLMPQFHSGKKLFPPPTKRSFGWAWEL
jgi:hypothetical protein